MRLLLLFCLSFHLFLSAQQDTSKPRIEIQDTDTIRFVRKKTTTHARSLGQMHVKALDSLRFGFFSPQYLRLKADLDIKSPQMNQGSKAFMRFGGDSLIWISVAPAMGIEVARGLVRKDSVFFVNRLEKSLYRFPSTYLENNFGIQLSTQDLSGILLGRVDLPDSTQSHVRQRDKWVSTYSEAGIQYIVHWMPKTGVQFMSMNGVVRGTPVSAQIQYSGSIDMGNGQRIPQKVNIVAKQGNQTNTVNIEYSAPDTSGSPNFGLSVGGNYEIRP